MKTRTIVWTLIAISGVGAFLLMQVTDIPDRIRLVCAWYALVIAFLLFAVAGVTLSIKFKRLDTPEGCLARLFFFL